jgi:hypothetical protein
MVWSCTAIPSGLGDIEDGAGRLDLGLRRRRVEWPRKGVTSTSSQRRDVRCAQDSDTWFDD